MRSICWISPIRCAPGARKAVDRAQRLDKVDRVLADGKTMASIESGDKGAPAILWDVTDQRTRHPGSVRQSAGMAWQYVAIAPDGRTLVTLSQQAGVASVSLYDLTDLSTPRALGDPLGPTDLEIEKAALATDGRVLATAEAGGEIVLRGPHPDYTTCGTTRSRCMRAYRSRADRAGVGAVSSGPSVPGHDVLDQRSW